MADNPVIELLGRRLRLAVIGGGMSTKPLSGTSVSKALVPSK